MDGPSCAPTAYLEKIRGLRHPLDIPCIDHMMLAALSDYMRNPKNWSNTLFDDLIRFRLGVETIDDIDRSEPHHYP
eukprot:5631843-Amphidinium_carterae.1